MIKQVEISSYIYVLMMVLVFVCSTAFGQEFINGDFNEKIAKDVVAVEFWADWNATNQRFYSFYQKKRIRWKSLLERV
jgi:hypothetical protein